MVDIFDYPIIRLRIGQVGKGDVPRQGVFFIIQYEFDQPPVLESFYGDTSHQKEWGDNIVPKFTQLYPCLKKEDIDLMYQAHTMFPRGRVGYDEAKKQWCVWIGSKQQYTHKLKVNIASAFGLNAVAASNRLMWMPDEHETRNPYDVHVLNRIIDRINECKGKDVRAGLKKFYTRKASKEQMFGIDDSKLDLMSLLKRKK